jgi:hypothetical protein
MNMVIDRCRRHCHMCQHRMDLGESRTIFKRKKNRSMTSKGCAGIIIIMLSKETTEKEMLILIHSLNI